MSQTYTRRGSHSSFSLNHNDELLRKAIKLMGRKGDESVDGFMRMIINEQVEEAKVMLKRMSGSLANVRVPKAKGVFNSKRASRGPVHSVVADALKSERIKSKEYRVHTGKTLRDADKGVIGQRGGKLAHIVAKGIDPFSYGKLPMLVMSSASWYNSHGAAGWVSTGMRMRRQHPGFYHTFDYIGYVDKTARAKFAASAPNLIYMLGVESGFTTQGSVKTSMKSRIGGKGLMMARGA